MYPKAVAIVASAVLGAGAAAGVTACGEDRGGVEVEGGTTGATGTATGGTGTVTGATGTGTGGTAATPEPAGPTTGTTEQTTTGE